MFISFEQKSRKTIYRLWFTVAVITLVVFGMVLIVYEEWQINKDNLSYYAPVDNVIFYFHLSKYATETDALNQLPLANKLINNHWPDFANQVNDFFEQGASEVSYIIMQEDDKQVDGWLLAVQNKNVSIQLPENLISYSFGQVQVIFQDESFLDKIKKAQSGERENLSKYLTGQTGHRQGNNYFYVKDISELEKIMTTPFLKELLTDVNLSGEWLMVNTQQGWQSYSLSDKSFFRLPKFNKKTVLWPQLFSEEDLVFFNVDNNFFLSLLNSRFLPKVFYQILDLQEKKYQLDLPKLLSEVEGGIDLAINFDQADDNQQFFHASWLAKAKVSTKGQEMIKEAVSLALGYSQPYEQEVTLPDGGKIIEMRVKPAPVSYQQIFINDQAVNIIYFNKNNYFVWFMEDNKVVLGNSMKMVNRYLAKLTTTNINPCLLEDIKQAIVYNLSEIKGNLGINNLIFIQNNDLDMAEFSICY